MWCYASHSGSKTGSKTRQRKAYWQANMIWHQLNNTDKLSTVRRLAEARLAGAPRPTPRAATPRRTALPAPQSFADAGLQRLYDSMPESTRRAIFSAKRVEVAKHR
jgi:hypothetical protein